MCPVTDTESVQLVKGFVAGVDKVPPSLQIRAPCFRFAVVTSTFDPSMDGSFAIQSKLLLDFCRSICTDLDCEIRFEGQGPDAFFHDFSGHGLEEKLSEELFKTITAQKGGRPRLQIMGAPWYKAGGPFPYHDSATLEIYCSDDDGPVLFGKARDFFLKRDVALNVVEADPHPTQSSRLKRMFSKLFK